VHHRHFRLTLTACSIMSVLLLPPSAFRSTKLRVVIRETRENCRCHMAEVPWAKFCGIQLTSSIEFYIKEDLSLKLLLKWMECKWLNGFSVSYFYRLESYAPMVCMSIIFAGQAYKYGQTSRCFSFLSQSPRKMAVCWSTAVRLRSRVAVWSLYCFYCMQLRASFGNKIRETNRNLNTGELGF